MKGEGGKMNEGTRNTQIRIYPLDIIRHFLWFIVLIRNHFVLIEEKKGKRKKKSSYHKHEKRLFRYSQEYLSVIDSRHATLANHG